MAQLKKHNITYHDIYFTGLFPWTEQYGKFTHVNFHSYNHMKISISITKFIFFMYWVTFDMHWLAHVIMMVVAGIQLPNHQQPPCWPNACMSDNFIISQWWKFDQNVISIWVSKHILCLIHCGLKWRHMATWIWVNIGSDDGLLLDGTKPLLEPMLTNHQQSPVTFIWR